MLPGESKKALQKLKIVPGAIVHIFCPYIVNPHEKFVVLVHVDCEDDLVLVFLINSEIHPLIKYNPDKSVCQVEMPVATYSFLDHDSFLDCSEVQEEFGYEELAAHLSGKPEDHKGSLGKDELHKVLQVVKGAKTIPDADKELIINSLGGQ